MVIFVPMSNLYINSVAISLVGRCLMEKEKNEIAQGAQSHMRLRPWWNSYLGVDCGVGCGLQVTGKAAGIPERLHSGQGPEGLLINSPVTHLRVEPGSQSS